jgi:hypothetical protein
MSYFALVTCTSRIFCHKAVNSKEISFKRTNSESTHRMIGSQ